MPLTVPRRYSPCHPYFNFCLVPFSSIFTFVYFMCEKVCARACMSECCVYVWLFVCCMITVGVLVFVASCVWLFLLDFTILSFIISSTVQKSSEHCPVYDIHSILYQISIVLEKFPFTVWDFYPVRCDSNLRHYDNDNDNYLFN